MTSSGHAPTRPATRQPRPSPPCSPCSCCSCGICADLRVVPTSRRPVHVVKYLWWHVSWHYRITYRREPYADDDKIYLLRRAFGLWQSQWNNAGPLPQFFHLTARSWTRRPRRC